MKKKGMTSDDIPPIQAHGTIHYTNKEKANAFNNFFIEQCTLDDNDNSLPKVEFNSIYMTDISISTDDVKSVIQNLHPNKATGPDKIHNKLLIAATDVMSPHFAFFFNRCLSESNSL